MITHDLDTAISKVSLIKRGVINPPLYSLHVMAKALNVKIEKLLGCEVDQYEV
jgi:hypothetical protein